MLFVIASNNEKKVEELSRILKPLGITAKTAAQLGTSLEDVEETGETFKENAEIKAKAACKKTGYPAIADDSGLMVDALGGRPGVYSARYAGENATDEQKINKLLDELHNSGKTDRTAHFECVICCYFPNGEELFAFGKCDGSIGYAPRGNDGFGYMLCYRNHRDEYLKVNDKDSFFEYVADLDFEFEYETNLCKEFAPRILCEGYRGYI